MISNVLSALRGTRGARLVRMSGSGATCFTIFATDADAGNAAGDEAPRRHSPAGDGAHAGTAELNPGVQLNSPNRLRGHAKHEARNPVTAQR